MGLTGVITLFELWRLARTKCGPLSTSYVSPKGADLPLISVLVPVWNGRAELSRLVDSFHALSLDAELLLCVGGQDGGWNEAQAYPSSNIRVIEQRAGEGKQAALAHLLPMARGSFVYLTDADCRLSDQCVAPLVIHLQEHPSVVAATGSSRPLSQQVDVPFISAQWSVQRASDPKSCTPTTGILGRNAVVRTEVLRATRAFEVPAPVGTDYTLAKELLRQGYLIDFVPDSTIDTLYPATLREYAKKQARWISNVLRLGLKYRAWSDVRRVAITTLFSLGLPILILLGVVWWPFWVLAGLLAWHAVVNRLRYQRMANLPLRPSAVLQHFMADQLAALLSGWRIASRSVKW